MIYKGQIKIEDKLVVSDPCYTLNTWCMAVLENVLPGNYKCFLEKTEEGSVSEILSEILIVHENYKINKEDVNNWEDYDIGVDSGQAGFYNYSYFKQYSDMRNLDEARWREEYYTPICDLTYHIEENLNYKKEVKEYEDKINQLEEELLIYDKENDKYIELNKEFCSLLSSKINIETRRYFYVSDGGILKEKAFVSSSGYGDGGYNCYTKKNEDGKIIAAKVIFIGEEEEDEE